MLIWGPLGPVSLFTFQVKEANNWWGQSTGVSTTQSNPYLALTLTQTRTLTRTQNGPGTGERGITSCAALECLHFPIGGPQKSPRRQWEREKNPTNYARPRMKNDKRYR